MRHSSHSAHKLWADKRRPLFSRVQVRNLINAAAALQRLAFRCVCVVGGRGIH